METKKKKQKPILIPIPTLPDQIVFQEILYRLPIKTLLRFRSVSKSWNSVISSDPRFSQLQFKNSMKNNLDLQKILLWDPSSPFLLDKDSFTVSKLNSPLKVCCSENNSISLIVGSCHCLVCIHLESDVLLFWNPLTGETKRVVEPPTKLPFPYCSSVRKERTDITFTYGLGYDLTTDDYKLFRICDGYDENGEKIGNKEVRVYSLRTDSWKQIQDFPHRIFSPAFGVFLDGALHWIALNYEANDDHWKVVSFDLAEEKYRLLDIRRITNTRDSFSVGVLDEKLCVCYYSGGDCHVLWLMHGYEDAESWTNCIIQTPSSWRLVPLSISKNGGDVLLGGHDGRLGVYNWKDCKVRHLRILGLPWKFRSMTILKNLISPKTFNGIYN